MNGYGTITEARGKKHKVDFINNIEVQISFQNNDMIDNFLRNLVPASMFIICILYMI
jgi:hypothetical protein